MTAQKIIEEGLSSGKDVSDIVAKLKAEGLLKDPPSVSEGVEEESGPVPFKMDEEFIADQMFAKSKGA